MHHIRIFCPLLFHARKNNSLKSFEAYSYDELIKIPKEIQDNNDETTDSNKKY